VRERLRERDSVTVERVIERVGGGGGGEREGEVGRDMRQGAREGESSAGIEPACSTSRG
jgi:hypothetical protein